MTISYVGKGGKLNTATMRNRGVARALREYSKGGGRLFSPAALTSARELLPQGMKLKDFRTIIATNEAIKALDAVVRPPPLTGDPRRDKRLMHAALKTASVVVADRLNNTPTVALGSYIHPMVYKLWARNKVGAHPDLWT